MSAEQAVDRLYSLSLAQAMRLFGVRHAHDALHRAEGFSSVDAHGRRHMVQHRGGASACCRLSCRRIAAWRPWPARRPPAHCSAPPCSCRSRCPAPPAPACAGRPAAGCGPCRRNFWQTLSAIFWSTMMRLVLSADSMAVVATTVSAAPPPPRPSTSASSSTTSGALPPSSSTTGLR